MDRGTVPTRELNSLLQRTIVGYLKDKFIHDEWLTTTDELEVIPLTNLYLTAYDQKNKVTRHVISIVYRNQVIAEQRRRYDWGHHDVQQGKNLFDEELYKKSYLNSGFDRGHLIPFGDYRLNTDGKQIFHYSNCAPQDPELNRLGWLMKERIVRQLVAHYQTAVVVTGTVIDRTTTGEEMEVEMHEQLEIAVPTHFYTTMLVKDANRQFKCYSWLFANEKTSYLVAHKQLTNQKKLTAYGITNPFKVDGITEVDDIADPEYDAIVKKLLEKRGSFIQKHELYVSIGTKCANPNCEAERQSKNERWAFNINLESPQNHEVCKQSKKPHCPACYNYLHRWCPKTDFDGKERVKPVFKNVVGPGVKCENPYHIDYTHKKRRLFYEYKEKVRCYDCHRFYVNSDIGGRPEERKWKCLDSKYDGMKCFNFDNCQTKFTGGIGMSSFLKGKDGEVRCNTCGSYFKKHGIEWTLAVQLKSKNRKIGDEERCCNCNRQRKDQTSLLNMRRFNDNIMCDTCLKSYQKHKQLPTSYQIYGSRKQVTYEPANKCVGL